VNRLSKCADLIGTHASNSSAWHDLRATGIGGSDIAAILGLSPWQSQFSLWHRKNGMVTSAPAKPEMLWGHYHEDTIARWYRDTHPDVRVSRTGTWRNRHRPWQLANPDRLLTGKHILEIKTDRSGDGWGQPGTDEIPVHYRAQVLWYLDCLGWDTARVAVLIGLSDARVYTIPWTEAETTIMRDAAEKFWRSLETGTPPPLDGSDSTYRAMRELHPHIADAEIEIPAVLRDYYRAALASEKDAAETKQLAAAELLDYMGTARRAVCEGESVAVRVAGPRGGTPSLRPSPVKRDGGQKIGEAA